MPGWMKILLLYSLLVFLWQHFDFSILESTLSARPQQVSRPLSNQLQSIFHISSFLFCSHYHHPASGLSASRGSPSHSNSCFSPWAPFIPSLVQALSLALIPDGPVIEDLLQGSSLLITVTFRKLMKAVPWVEDFSQQEWASPVFLGVLFRQVIMMLIPYVSWEASRNNPGTCTAPLPELQGCSVNIYVEVLPDTSLSSPD